MKQKRSVHRSLNSTVNSDHSVESITATTKQLKLVACIIVIAAIITQVIYKNTNTYNHGILRSNQLHVINCSTDSSASTPSNHMCGRLAIDDYIDIDASSSLKYIIDSALELSGGSGSCVSIYDIASGTVSMQHSFANIYKLAKYNHTNKLFNQTHMDVYNHVVDRIVHTIYDEFNVSKLYLTSPSFISRITSLPALSLNDEYWHTHIDTQQYKSFVYTALIYLNTHNHDYTGGEFIFESTSDNDVHLRVLPSTGKLLVFSSGAENPHHVNRVHDGVRYAMTIAFTNDPNKSINTSNITNTININK